MLPEIGTDETLDDYRNRLLVFVQGRFSAPEAIKPSGGGCWYCLSNNHIDAFSMEFDTYLHTECVRRWLKANPRDEEVRLISTELSLGQVG